MSKMNWKVFIGACALSGLMACGSSVSDQAGLEEAGVSRELARSRKTNFSEVRYNLFFSIPESREAAVEGRVELSLRLNERQPLIIDFRGDSSQVHSVALNGKGVPFAVRNEHIIIAADQVAKGENRVAIAFTPADQSLNRRDEFLYTLLVPDRARTVFPCFDQPDMKSLFTLTLELPADWQAVSNGAVAAEDDTDLPGRRRVVFHETEPLSTYLFSFVAGRLEREEYMRGDRRISIYHRETDPKRVAQCPAIADEVFDALEWQERYTGVPYPFAKYDLIILPGFQFGGMEHTGATLYADRRMFLDEHPTLNDRLGRSALIAHETAHMWFGDYVTMEWFDDVWTKEVFANYFASRIVEPLYPEVNHRLNFIRDYIPAAYAEDRTAGANPIKQRLDNMRDAGLVYGNIIYDKSPVVMEMLVRRLGEEAFRKGIREYLATYAYGNATWEGLIRILDKYTNEDLAAWSDVWVNQEGMPEISATIKEDGRLLVRQRDPLGRGLRWPQELSYRVIAGDSSAVVPISFGIRTDSVVSQINWEPSEKNWLTSENPVVVPNTDGRGYGFFRVTEGEMPGLWQTLRASDDEVLRGSLLITLYENLRRKTIAAPAFREALLDYLPTERNSLLFSLAIGYLGDCQRLFPGDTEPLERALWEMVQMDPVPQHRLQAFRLYRSVASSEEAVRRLYDLWKARKSPAKDCELGEGDYINLSYQLALRLPERADAIVAEQLGRITNPDRRKEYTFISPSVSPRREVRDSVFAALLVPENRRVEPWASSALAFLNHQGRERESIAYIRPALEALPEVQRTGDIFFPTAWLRALLSGHISREARDEVEAFLAAHPDLSPMLMRKIKQQASHLY